MRFDRQDALVFIRFMPIYADRMATIMTIVTTITMPIMMMRQGRPGFICGGKSDFFFTALYFPMKVGKRVCLRSLMRARLLLCET